MIAGGGNIGAQQKKRTKVKCQLFRNYNRSQRVLKMVQKGEGKKSGERISD